MPVGFAQAPTTPRDTALLSARGLLTEVARLGSAQGNFAPVAGTVYGCLVGLVAGDVVSKVWVCMASQASGAAPTRVELGLFSTSGTLLAATGDVSSALLGQTGPVGFSLTAPYTVLASDGYYLAYYRSGTWGGANESIVRWTSINATGIAPAGGVRACAIKSGHAGALANLTWANSGGTTSWLGCS